MSIRLNGSTSGYVEIDAPATAGSNTLVLPTGNGSADQALVTDGSGTLSFADRGRIIRGTAQNSTSGTSIDFTGIPSWVKRVTVMFNGVSTNGSSSYLVQIGAGSVVATGYTSLGNDVNSANGTGGTSSTAGFLIRSTASGTAANGHMTLVSFGSNIWVSSHVMQLTSTNSGIGGGTVTLSGTLDRIRITTVSGTDAFDAGTINIMYEG